MILPLDAIRTLRELHELLEALDRRVPRLQRVGEPAIARDAAALRLATIERIAEING